MEKISIDIDVTQITKARLKSVMRKNGKEAKYLKATLVPSKDNQYGNDYFIAEATTKEERDQGVKGAIIGNARVLAFKQDAPQPTATPRQLPQDQMSEDDVPF